MVWLVRGRVQMGWLWGAASQPMEGSSLFMASTRSSGCKWQKSRLGVEAVFLQREEEVAHGGSGLAPKVSRARLGKGISGLSQV